MEGCLPLFILAVVGFIVVIGVIAAVSSAPDRARGEDRGRTVAGMLGGTYRPAAHGRPAAITWTVRGLAAKMTLDRTVEPGLDATVVSVGLSGHSPGSLIVGPEGWMAPVLQRFSSRDVPVGDRNFDARYVVKANPESLAGRVFSPERRARAVAAVTRLGRYGVPFVDVSREQLRVGVVARLETVTSLKELAESSSEFVDLLLDVEPAAPILWIEEKLPGGGQCQVCGTEMREGVVHCARCQTPHHEECWRYMGECSTFACKETRYVVDGRVVRPTGARLKPREALRAERERDRRETGGGRRG